MSEIKLTQENAMAILSQYTEAAQQKGAYLLHEAALLKKAIDYFNPSIKEKPSFTENDQNPQAIAQNLLIQAVQVGQSKGAYSLADASIIFQILRFIEQSQKESAAAAPQSESSASSITVQDESSSDVEAVRARRGKAAAI